MKYVILLGDGMADFPIPELNNLTPLEAAKKPYMDAISTIGENGLVKTVPEGFPPGSDVANLSVMGYDPEKYYTGRSPLEAVSIGIKMKPTDCSFRCNLVNLTYNGDDYSQATMHDYSSDEISTAEARVLMEAIQNELGDDIFAFYGGFSYRHCLIWSNCTENYKMTPPHDITDRPIMDYLPNDAKLLDLQIKSRKILENHPINSERVKRGLLPANSIWLWGQGRTPQLDKFKQLYSLDGAVISAVDLIKGIGICADLEIYEVEGATGNIDTNFLGKAQATVAALDSGKQFVYLHIEAPDECGHRHEIENKVKAIEFIDDIVLKHIIKYIASSDEAVKILIMPDHPTPLSLRTHVSDPVPYCSAIITPEVACSILNNEIEVSKRYCEKTGANANNNHIGGSAFMKYFLNGMAES